MKYIFTFSAILLTSIYSIGQLNMNSPNNNVSNPINCSTYNSIVANFFDNGTSTNYVNNFNDTLTVCPDIVNGTKITFSSLTADGYIWNVDPTDTLYIFDGPSTLSPLVASINSGTHPLGYRFTSSFTNLSGCLTFVFHSNAASNNIGWSANLICTKPAQPIDINLEAFVNSSSTNSLLSDSVFIDLCLGDTLILTIHPDYINSLQSTGVGYSQNDANVLFRWEWSTGEVFLETDTIQYVANTSSGFISRIILRDSLTFSSIRDVYIRVGTIPNFGGLFASPDTLCIGESSMLFGGFNSTDTTLYGFTIPPANFVISGAVAGTTYLPDGTGTSYTTDIPISGFPPNQVLTAQCGISEICLEMEHSYIGDLIATITCPNGTIATLFNGNNTSPLNTFLGEPYEDPSSVAGNGYNYCFSDAAQYTFAQVGAGSPGTTTTLVSPPAPSSGATITSGSYKPQNNLTTSLLGCPLNGNWTITVTDDQGADDGYIFQWGINFSSCNYGDSLTYQNYPVSGGYINVNPIISQTDSTKITIPSLLGNNPYVFRIIDDFGCPHDTTINVIVHYVDVLETDSICTGSLNMTTNNATQPGIWSFYNSPGTPVFASSTNVNTSVTFPTPGIYHIVYTTTTTCVAADTATISYFGDLPFNLNAPFFVCPNAPKVFTIGNSSQFDSVMWISGSTPPIVIANPNAFSNSIGIGSYTINGVGNNGCPYDTTFVITSQPPVVIIHQSTMCNDSINMIFNTGPSQLGHWSYIPPSIGAFPTFEHIDSLNTGVSITTYGTYQLIFTEPTCLDDDTLSITFIPGVYFDLSDFKICEGKSITLAPMIVLPDFVTSMIWSTGETTPTINVSQAGNYTFTISNSCETKTDSSIITMKVCDIEMPNVFTPNGDGINDFYHMIGDKEIFKSFHIVIVDRWGVLIKEYDDPTGKWDGTDNKGNYVTTGVYTYYVDSVTLQDDKLIKNGFIEVLNPTKN